MVGLIMIACFFFFSFLLPIISNPLLLLEMPSVAFLDLLFFKCVHELLHPCLLYLAVQIGPEGENENEKL